MTEPASRRSQPRWRGLVALVLLVAGSACQAVSRPQPLESVPAESTGGPAPASGQPSDPAGGPGQACQATVTVPADLEQRVATVEAQTGTQISLSLVDPNRGPITAGSLSPTVAWSTSKVPLALTVVQDQGPQAQPGAVRSALRESDNEAADQLWRSLGPAPTAATRVTAVLRQAGDATTVVPATAARPPYSIFGQTIWSTAEQARFMQHLPCLPGAELVIGHLQQVSSEQRWGIAGRPGATYKGGWGPARQSGFEARQLGWYQGRDGSRTVVAMAVRAGTFPEATRVLNLLAGQLP